MKDEFGDKVVYEPLSYSQIKNLRDSLTNFLDATEKAKGKRKTND